MEREQLPKTLIDTSLEKQTPHVEESQSIQINNGVDLGDINQDITQKISNIKNTMDRINDIRKELNLSSLNEIPHSVEQAQNSIDKLNTEKPELETYNFKIAESLPEESPEEYIGRSMTGVVDDYIENDEHINKLPRLLKRAYYGRHAHQSMIKFFSNEENSKKVKEILFQLDENDNKKFSESKNNETLNNLDKKVWGSNKDSASGEDNDKREYYAKTNQVRDFFSPGRKHDAYSYSSMMFGLPEDFVKTKEGREYIHNQVDNKTIFLFGGGDSIKDLLKSEEFKPKKVINFDPFIKEETIDKNQNGVYESLILSASDKQIREMVKIGEIPMADEVWATYSVPFYLDSPDDIKNLIENMSEVLNEGGNARISPIAVQHHRDENGNTFETRRDSLITSIKELIGRSDYNISVFNDTLKIHKIKKEDTPN